MLATRNAGKILEIKDLLGNIGIEFLTLDDFPGIPDVAEDGKSFFDNALIKARFVSEWTGYPSLADDSGLEIEALGGKPGIHSARYSGKNATDQNNILKVLDELKDISSDNRKAFFTCVIVLYCPGGKYEFFEGILQGSIAYEQRGSYGFGYDPIFIIPEFNKTAAEILPELKNSVSHRAKALEKLRDKLKERMI